MTLSAAILARPSHELVLEARRALDLHTNVSFARFLGISLRTVQRHTRTGGLPIGPHGERMVRALHPQHTELAKRYAQATHLSLIELGLEAAPEKAPPPAGPPPARREHASMVICAAADALNMLPRDVRPVLATIFGQTRAIGVDLDGLTKLLAEGGGAAAKAKAAR